jgi:hypothetical protein
MNTNTAFAPESHGHSGQSFAPDGQGSQSVPGQQNAVASPAPATKQARSKASLKKEDAPFAAEIAALEEKLSRAREKQREAVRKQQEKNARDVRDLIKAQKWENFPIEVWQLAVESIGSALKQADDKFQTSGQPSKTGG